MDAIAPDRGSALPHAVSPAGRCVKPPSSPPSSSPALGAAECPTEGHHRDAPGAVLEQPALPWFDASLQLRPLGPRPRLYRVRDGAVDCRACVGVDGVGMGSNGSSSGATYDGALASGASDCSNDPATAAAPETISGPSAAINSATRQCSLTADNAKYPTGVAGAADGGWRPTRLGPSCQMRSDLVEGSGDRYGGEAVGRRPTGRTTPRSTSRLW